MKTFKSIALIVLAALAGNLAASVPNQDDQIWIAANGLTLKTVSDAQAGGKKAHAETRVTYDNVHAPAGAH